jgi:ditrans,polycis-polyprenyl diphosphate synthase
MLLSHSSSATATTRGLAAAPPPARSRRARLLPPRARAADTTGVGADRAAEALLVQSGLRPESLPRHVAVVMDGNSRWARARGLTPADGHKAGGRNLERVVGLSRAWGIRALTAFVCSRENLSRPKARPRADAFATSPFPKLCVYFADEPDTHGFLAFSCLHAGRGRLHDGFVRVADRR